MTNFMKNTMSDIRAGRQSWRVMSVFSGSSLMISVAAVLLHQPF